MLKRVFGFLVLAFALFGTQCWAQENCINEDGPVSCSFRPGTTTGTFDFSGTGDGVLTIQFKTVLTPFSLTVTVNPFDNMVDFSEFPEGTTAYTYSSRGQHDQYDITGTAGGPNGTPRKNIDYTGLIDVTLSYFYSSEDQSFSPAFGHAPGASTTFSEDILTSFSTPPVSDPGGTMKGKTPGLSSLAALKKPNDNDTICFVSPTQLQTISASQVDEIDVAFRLFSGGSCSGTPLRDKTAHLTLALTDSSGNFISSVTVKDKEDGGNKFHWEPDERVNELDLSTEGLATGNYYTITVISDKAGPKSVTFKLI
jgi:hypothetical protein